MSDKFTVEIITPVKSILKSEATQVTIPAYEGQLGILKDHIPLITFLRPGFINIEDQNEKKYFIEEGTVEFSNNNLLILTSTAIDLNNFEKNSINSQLEIAENKIKKTNLTDKEKYLESHKIDALKEIN